MITLRFLQDEPCGVVLDLLYARDLFIGYSCERSIAAVQSWRDHRIALYKSNNNIKKYVTVKKSVCAQCPCLVHDFCIIVHNQRRIIQNTEKHLSPDSLHTGVQEQSSQRNVFAFVYVCVCFAKHIFVGHLFRNTRLSVTIYLSLSFTLLYISAVSQSTSYVTTEAAQKPTLDRS